MHKAPTKAIMYSAFSSAKGGDTIQSQEADCQAMADREEWAVIGRYSDVGKSGFKGDRGQGLADAMAHAEREAPCVLVARDPERFARGDAQGADGARSFAEVSLWARRNNVEIRCVRDDAMVRHPMLASIVSELVNAESARKSERAKSGARDARAKGKRTGRTSYGYMPGKDGVTLVNPETAPVVVRIFEQLAAGVPVAELARQLNAERAATGSPSIVGKAWAQGSLSKLVRNRVYLGEVPADDPADRADRLKPEAWKPGHEAIIEPALWEAAQARIAERSRQPGKGGGRTPKADHLLGGKLLRHICGNVMEARTNVNAKGEITSARYLCMGQKNGTCASGGLRVDREAVDEAVLAFVASVAIDADETVRRSKAAADKAKDDHALAVAHAEGEIARATKGLERALEDYMAEVLTADDLKAIKAKWTTKREDAQARLSALQTAEPLTAEEVVSATVDALSVVRQAIDAGDTQRVVNAVRQVFDHFVIAEDVPAPIDWADPVKALAAMRDRVSAAETKSGRTVAQANADALEDDGVAFDAPTGDERPLTAAESADDEALRAQGLLSTGAARQLLPGALVIVPMPRRDAMATALVDAHGRLVHSKQAMTTNAQGLARKSSAPRSNARSRSTSPSRPESTSTGVRGSTPERSPSAVRTSRRTSRPVPSGRFTSTSRTSG